MDSATRKNHFSRIAPELLMYVSATFVTVLILILTLQLWKADFHVPFGYTNGDSTGSGDAMWIYMLAKSLIDVGWVQHNPYLGMPIGMNLLDFPVTEILHLFFMKCIAFVTADFAVTVTMYYLAGFVLAALTMTACAREVGLKRLSSVSIGILYAFLPGHFQHGQAHLFIGAYYLIPLGVMVCLWIAQERPLFSTRGILAILICVISGVAYVYYAFFLGLFLLISGIFTALRIRMMRPIWESLALATILSLSFLITVSPNLAYRAKNGPNPILAERPLDDAELYVLRVAQMVLPVSGHRIPALASLRDLYNSRLPHLVESDFAALGIIGTCGFLFSLVHIMRRVAGAPAHVLLDTLSIMTLAALLIATTGGFNTLFLMASRLIRSYSRISFFIAAFSLLIVGYGIEQIASRFQPKAMFAIWPLLLVIGLLDQTTAGFVPDYAANKADFQSDHEFVQRIESVMPDRAMIYQIPLAKFPENPVIFRMNDYQLFRGYLHSTKLRWSYGAVKGREIDQWEQKFANLMADQKVAVMRREGFVGLYVDTYGFPDASIVTNFQNLLKTQPIISRNGRLAFFKIADVSSQ